MIKCACSCSQWLRARKIAKYIYNKTRIQGRNKALRGAATGESDSNNMLLERTVPVKRTLLWCRSKGTIPIPELQHMLFEVKEEPNVGSSTATTSQGPASPSTAAPMDSKEDTLAPPGPSTPPKPPKRRILLKVRSLLQILVGYVHHVLRDTHRLSDHARCSRPCVFASSVAVHTCRETNSPRRRSFVVRTCWLRTREAT